MAGQVIGSSSEFFSETNALRPAKCFESSCEHIDFLESLVIALLAFA
jgi:hypothetical protein